MCAGYRVIWARKICKCCVLHGGSLWLQVSARELVCILPIFPMSDFGSINNALCPRRRRKVEPSVMKRTIALTPPRTPQKTPQALPSSSREQSPAITSHRLRLMQDSKPFQDARLHRVSTRCPCTAQTQYLSHFNCAFRIKRPKIPPTTFPPSDIQTCYCPSIWRSPCGLTSPTTLPSTISRNTLFPFESRYAENQVEGDGAVSLVAIWVNWGLSILNTYSHGYSPEQST